jgi:DNA-binding MarR family transcriptional regulator
MSTAIPRRIPISAGQQRPANLAVLMREAFVTLNDLVLQRLAERGHGDVRPAHSAVFQYLDDTGTTVSVLAERAQMTKQAMAELVRHLEFHGYVVRVPDPADQRAKLVLPTDRGHEVFAIAQQLVPEIEGQVSSLLGEDRVLALRSDLSAIRSFGAERLTSSATGSATGDSEDQLQGRSVTSPH